ncbi:MAG: hypothetical protein OEZ13_04515 [Spirochaetia bacterium]|nr:hypothetical protein [Spirochaetia bacterium]
MKKNGFLVKICGLTNLKDAKDAYEKGADYLGIVLHPLSKRCADIEKAQNIINLLPDAKFVLVFGFDEEDYILSCRQKLKTKNLYVQLPSDHKSFDSIIQKIDVENIIPSVAVKEEIAPEIIKKFDIFSFVIFDSAGIQIDKTKIIPGGSGKTFNWNFLVNINMPFLLAGGINLENVSEALEKVNPLGVDTASGVEKSYGIKDTEKMINFIKLVKSKQRR